MTDSVMENVLQIEARHTKTTPGIWVALGKSVGTELGTCTCGAGMGPYPHESGCGLEGPVVQGAEHDIEFVAHAHQDVPWLTGQLKRYKAAVEAAHTLASVWEEDAAPDEWMTLGEASKELLGVIKDALEGDVSESDTLS